MKIQNAFVMVVLALVTAACSQQEMRQSRHDEFVKALGIRSLSLVEDLTQAESKDPLTPYIYAPLTGYAKDDRGNCFYVTTSQSKNSQEILTVAAIPCNTLAPKK